MARRGRALPVRAWWVAPTVAVTTPTADGGLSPVPQVAHAVELIERPFVFVGRPPTPFTAPVEGVARPTVAQPPQPIPFLQQSPYVFVERVPDSGAAPQHSTVVTTVELPQSQSFISITAGRVDPPVVAPQPPLKPVVVVAQSPQQSLPFVGVNSPKVGAAAAAPQVPVRPTVVSNLGPAETGFAGWTVLNVDSGIAPPPPVEPTSTRSVVVGAQAPPPEVDQIILYTVVSQGLPQRSTIVDAGPLPPQILPFTHVTRTRVAVAAPPPEVPVKPTVVRAEPVPPPYGASIVDRGFAVAVPPAAPEVPVKPTVVNAQPLPPLYGSSSVSHGFAEALAAPSTPPKPIVVGAQPYPPPTQTPRVSWTSFDEKITLEPLIIRQEPYSPQQPFVFTPKAGRWGNPPPNHRIIQPSVTVDMSLPFRPHGWARVAHGFAEALPLLFEGTVVGGTLEGPLVSGGVMTGSGVGGTVQNGYITGGRR